MVKQNHFISKNVVEFILLIITFVIFLFFTGCDRSPPWIDEKPKEKPKEKLIKIQKNSSFRPSCSEENNVLPVCEKGWPACGTHPGSGVLRVYCIDKDDIIFKDDLESEGNLEMQMLHAKCSENIVPFCSQLSKSNN